MSVVVSFRISRELKKKMDSLKTSVNWSEEIRKFIEEKVREYERLRVIEDVENLIKTLPEMPRGTVTLYVREDRDSN
ncbi:MAG: CopG family transcriptional regulator [Sulfolobales archaeon]|nr:CopG family transcriptional regulator [Sulfolobales archaeon]MCX8198761.1 CopG family transcriptional regulator [Sulfolobales archaeon]MDW8169834.1 CopG family transcriptional regulator [Desulfurococcaceae archaeon]